MKAQWVYQGIICIYFTEGAHLAFQQITYYVNSIYQFNLSKAAILRINPSLLYDLHHVFSFQG